MASATERTMTHPSPTAPLPPHLERAYEAKVFKAARPKGSHNAPHLNLACALADDVVALHNRLEAAEAQLATRLPDRGPTHFLGYDEIGNCWFVAAIERRAELKAWTENYGDDREDPEGIIRVLPAGLSFSNVHFGTEKPSPIFPALLSGAATPAPTAAPPIDIMKF